jgi:hypothetical protein
MTPADLSVIIMACGLNMPPTLTAERILAHATVESGQSWDAVSPPNRNGTRDYGFMQINQIHFARFQVNQETVLERCTNLRAGMTILVEADARSACIYNTGRPNCTNGYDVRIMRAAANLMNGTPASAPELPTPQPAQRPGCVVPEWDVWARCPTSPPASTPPATTETQSSEPVILRGLAMGTPSP